MRMAMHHVGDENVVGLVDTGTLDTGPNQPTAALAGATLAETMARLGHSTPKAAMLYQQVASGRAEEIAAGLSRLAEKG
jgi:hypothetical protein